MPVHCSDCDQTFALTPEGMTQTAACPHCGGTRLERDQPSPTHSDGELRDMVDPGIGLDQGGNPLQEGIFNQADGGWQPNDRRDESYASVRTAATVIPPTANGVDPSVEGRSDVTRAGIHNAVISTLCRLPHVTIDGTPVNQDTFGQLYGTYGMQNSPQYGQPVEVQSYHPGFENLAAKIIAEGHGNPNSYKDDVMALQQGIKAGQIPPPPKVAGVRIPDGWDYEVEPVHYYANPYVSQSIDRVIPQDPYMPWTHLEDEPQQKQAAFLPVAGEALSAIAPGLMRGALMGTGSSLVKGLLGGGGGQQQQQGPPPLLQDRPAQLLGHRQADLETPTSNPGYHDHDGFDADQKEFQDGSTSTNPHNPELDGDAGGAAKGEDEVRDHAGFGPNSPGVERAQMLMPLIMHYYNSPESGENDPMLRSLHEQLEAESPGYLDKADENAAREYVQKMKEPSAVAARVAQMPPFQQQQSFGVQPSTGPLVPQQTVGPPQSQDGHGKCPFCGGTTTADGTCPQCGAKANPLGGANVGMGNAGTGQYSMPPMMGKIAADHQGPVTREQQSAVAELLEESGRSQEIPNMLQQPWDYANELAQVAHRINQPPNVDPSDPPPPVPAQEIAPPGATMPMPNPADPSQMQSSYKLPNGYGEFPTEWREATVHESTVPCPCQGQPNCPACHGLGIIQHTPTGPDVGYQAPVGGPHVNPAPSVAPPGYRGAADNAAPRCPNCGSATTGMRDGGDSSSVSCQCHSCGNIWTPKGLDIEKVALDGQNPNALPAADQEHRQDDMGNVDSSHTWQDEAGQPLIEGSEYQMANPAYAIPDVVKIVKVKPDALVVATVGEFSNDAPGSTPLSYQYEITKQEADMEHLTFATADSTSQDPNPSQLQGDPNAVNTEPQPQADTHEFGLHAHVEEELSDSICPKCASEHIASVMSSDTSFMHECYRCSNIWETRDAGYEDASGLVDRSWINDDSDGDFYEDMTRHRAMASAGMASRNIQDVAARDPRYQEVKNILDQNAMAREAGRKYTPREQKEFINESGVARNADMLDLEGTHYKTRSHIDRGRGRAADGESVPHEHLLMGI